MEGDGCAPALHCRAEWRDQDATLLTRRGFDQERGRGRDVHAGAAAWRPGRRKAAAYVSTAARTGDAGIGPDQRCEGMSLWLVVWNGTRSLPCESGGPFLQRKIGIATNHTHNSEPRIGNTVATAVSAPHGHNRVSTKVRRHCNRVNAPRGHNFPLYHPVFLMGLKMAHLASDGQTDTK